MNHLVRCGIVSQNFLACILLCRDVVLSLLQVVFLVLRDVCIVLSLLALFKSRLACFEALYLAVDRL